MFFHDNLTVYNLIFVLFFGCWLTFRLTLLLEQSRGALPGYVPHFEHTHLRLTWTKTHTQIFRIINSDTTCFMQSVIMSEEQVILVCLLFDNICFSVYMLRIEEQRNVSALWTWVMSVLRVSSSQTQVTRPDWWPTELHCCNNKSGLHNSLHTSQAQEVCSFKNGLLSLTELISLTNSLSQTQTHTHTSYLEFL